MSWITETRQRQDAALAVDQQRSLLISDLSLAFLGTLEGDIRTAIEEINSVYPDRYPLPSSRLRVCEGTVGRIEVRLGTNFEVLSVRRMESGRLFDVRHQLPGMRKAVTTYYHCHLDHQERLYLESNGQPVPTEKLSQKILSFLVE